jgi:hypothetical protein
VLGGQPLERLDLTEADLDEVVVSLGAGLVEGTTGSFDAGLDLLLELAHGNHPFIARSTPSIERVWNGTAGKFARGTRPSVTRQVPDGKPRPRISQCP